jgi:mannose-6-phosphate isomerase-like protein (cupin superfamily)
MKIIRSTELELVPASHEDPKSPGVLKKVLLREDDFVEGKVHMINLALLPVGKSFKPHYHEDMQEVFVIIRGDAKIAVGKEQTTAGPGDVIVIPPGSIHRMENIGKENVEYVAIGVSQGKDGKTVVVQTA